MQTHAFMKGLDSAKSLIAERKGIVLQANADIWKNIGWFRAVLFHGLLFFLVAFMIATHSFNHNNTLESFLLHVVLSIIIGLFFASGAFFFQASRAENKEVSNGFYLKLSELRKEHEDLGDLRSKQETLTLRLLVLHMKYLLKILESEISHPDKGSFRYDDYDVVELFDFHSYR